MVWHFTGPGKMWTPNFEKYVYMYNVITRATIKIAIQRDTQNITDTSKCNSKTCSTGIPWQSSG